MHACQIKLCITQNYTSLYHFKCPSITINSTVNYKSRNLTHHCISLGKYENIRNTRFLALVHAKFVEMLYDDGTYGTICIDQKSISRQWHRNLLQHFNLRQQNYYPFFRLVKKVSKDAIQLNWFLASNSWQLQKIS